MNRNSKSGCALITQSAGRAHRPKADGKMAVYRARSIVCVFFLVVSVSLTAGIADAGPGRCDGSIVTNDYGAWTQMGSAVGCTAGIPSGAAKSCVYFSNGPYRIAYWPSLTARIVDTVGGCIFMCTSGDCRVGNDGLPVELLQFGVQ
jgi:hypothetical protein